MGTDDLHTDLQRDPYEPDRPLRAGAAATSRVVRWTALVAAVLAVAGVVTALVLGLSGSPFH